LQNIVFDYSDMHLHGSAFYDFLKLRKRFFVDGLGWNLPTDGVVEMDQYDTPNCYYSVVLSDGKLVAGARTQCSTAMWNGSSCMLRDAVTTGLPGIPKDIMDVAVCGPNVWECTRLAVSDDLRSVQLRTHSIALAIDGLIRTILENGGDTMISFTLLPLQRTFQFMGVDAHRISEPYTCADDGRQYAVFRAKVERPVDRLTELGIDTINCQTATPKLAKAL